MGVIPTPQNDPKRGVYLTPLAVFNWDSNSTEELNVTSEELNLILI